MKREFYEQFIIDDEFYENSGNYQRFHYKDHEKWDAQRSSYENKFNQKYGFAKHRGRKSKKNQKHFHTGKSREKYWEEDPVSDRYTTYGFYENPEKSEWDNWMHNWEFKSGQDPWDRDSEFDQKHCKATKAREKQKNMKKERKKAKKEQKRAERNNREKSTRENRTASGKKIALSGHICWFYGMAYKDLQN